MLKQLNQHHLINSAHIDGNKITWIQKDSTGFSIYYKNLATGYKTKIYSSKQLISNQDISGSRVVWEQYDINNKSTIYYKNLATGTSGKVMHSSLNQNNAKISGTRIVWVQEMVSGEGAIYERNLASNFIGKLYASPYTRDPLIFPEQKLYGNRHFNQVKTGSI
ncbi:MAG: hypothetical protein PHY59_03365 [Methanobacterium sp.]|nr:hypothetical protein [Methanobacterium sp.]